MQTFGQLIDLMKSVAGAAWRHFPIVIASVVLWLGGAILFATTRSPLYTASMIVKSAEDHDVGSSGITISLPGLSSLSGTLPAYLKLLPSRELAQLLLDRDHIDKLLFAGSVDPASGNWKARPPGIAQVLDRLFSIPSAPRPTADDVQQSLNEMVTITRDDISGIATVTCASSRPELCVQLLAASHREAEYRLRQIRLEQAVRTRDYVDKTVPATADPDMRTTMRAALATANSQILGAQLETPVGAVLLQPPAATSRPAYPKPGLVLAVGLLFGLGFGIGLAWLIGDRRLSPFRARRAPPVP